jgi:hypothetical protein
MFEQSRCRSRVSVLPDPSSFDDAGFPNSSLGSRGNAACAGSHVARNPVARFEVSAPGRYRLLERTVSPTRNRFGPNGACVFAWGFGFIQGVLELGMGAALQRQVTDAWTRGDRDQVNPFIACGTNFYSVMAVIQVVILLAIAYLALPAKFQEESRPLIVGPLWIQTLSAPFFGLLTLASSVWQEARRVCPQIGTGDADQHRKLWVRVSSQGHLPCSGFS